MGLHATHNTCQQKTTVWLSSQCSATCNTQQPVAMSLLYREATMENSQQEVETHIVMCHIYN